MLIMSYQTEPHYAVAKLTPQFLFLYMLTHRLITIYMYVVAVWFSIAYPIALW